MSDKHKMKTIMYDDIHKEVLKVVKERSRNKEKESSLHFSIFEEIDVGNPRHADDNWQVSIPDFKSTFTNGSVVFSSGDYISNIYKNPIWEDVVWEAHRCIRYNNQEDHVFLELVDLDTVDDKGVKHYKFWFGS